MLRHEYVARPRVCKGLSDCSVPSAPQSRAESLLHMLRCVLAVAVEVILTD